MLAKTLDGQHLGWRWDNHVDTRESCMKPLDIENVVE